MRFKKFDPVFVLLFIFLVLYGCRSVKPGLLEITTIERPIEQKKLTVNFIFLHDKDSHFAYKLDRIENELLPLIRECEQLEAKASGVESDIDKKTRSEQAPYKPATTYKATIWTTLDILDDLFGPSASEMQNSLYSLNLKIGQKRHQILSLINDLNLPGNKLDYINFIAFRHHAFTYADMARLKLSYLRSLKANQPYAVMNFISPEQNKETVADFTVWIKFYGGSCLESGDSLNRISHGAKTTSLMIYKIEKNGEKISTVYDQVNFFTGEAEFDMSRSKEKMTLKALHALMDILEKNIPDE